MPKIVLNSRSSGLWTCRLKIFYHSLCCHFLWQYWHWIFLQNLSRHKIKFWDCLLSWKYGLSHKPVIGGFCWFMLWLPGISERKVAARTVYPQHPSHRCALVHCHTALNKHKFCFKLGGKQLWYIKCLKLYKKMKLCIVCIFSNGWKNPEGDA